VISDGVRSRVKDTEDGRVCACRGASVDRGKGRQSVESPSSCEICERENVWLKASENNKFEIMLTRRAKAYQFLFANCQSISSHFVAVHSWSVRCSQRSQKSTKTPYFGSSESFKVINVDTIKRLVTSACCETYV